MRRFLFRLQHMFNMKVHARKEIEQRLGVITSRCNALDDRMQELIQRRTNANDQNHAGGSILENLHHRAGFSAFVDQELAKLKQERAVAEEQRLKIIEEYHEALQAEKVLEKLREKREREYYLEAARKEEKEVEDIVTDRYIREGGVDGQLQ